jgi:hypothetical protein
MIRCEDYPQSEGGGYLTCQDPIKGKVSSVESKIRCHCRVGDLIPGIALEDPLP